MEEIIEEVEAYLQDVPDGSLYTRHNHNSVQYYWKNGVGNERYIRRSEIELARQLAQKDYANKLIKFVMKQKKALETNILIYDRDEIVKFHENFSIERQELITPFIMSADDYADLWQKKNKQLVGDPGAYPLDADSGIVTERGELVRSKSEKIIADKLYMMNVPYVYERKLKLNGGKIVYPDFTVYNRFTRKEFYWEHYGMMSNPEYALNAIKKISTYRKNGIYEGDKLLLTYEANKYVLNVRELEELIEKFLL